MRLVLKGALLGAFFNITFFISFAGRLKPLTMKAKNVCQTGMYVTCVACNFSDFRSFVRSF